MQLGIDPNNKLTKMNKNENKRKMSDSLVGATRLKMKRDTSENAERLMMETLAKVTREKNELEHMMDEEKNMKREYEKEIANLRKSLRDTQQERQQLSSNLDKQQKIYLNLQKKQNKKLEALTETAGRTRTLTLEEKEQEEKDKIELLEAVDEQKAYIEQLEIENERLNATKIKDDDEMFYQLQQLRTHRFAPSINFDASNMGSEAGLFGGGGQPQHSRGASGSMSITADYNANFALGSNSDFYGAGQLKAVRTQVNLFNINLDEDFDEDLDDDETKLINYSIKDDELTQTKTTDVTIQIDAAPMSEANTMEIHDTPITPPAKQQKKVSFQPKNDEKEKEKLKRRKMEEISKVNAEIEFFLLTCIAVKTNLYEEYPNKAEVVTEDAMKLFQDAQKEHIVMAKFSLWIELKLRSKYDLPKIRGFQKFLDKHGVKKQVDKTKKVLKRAGTLAKETGKKLGADGNEIVARLRAHSKGYGSDNEGGREHIPPRSPKTPKIKEEEEEILNEKKRNHDVIDETAP
eukprot:145700_1